MKLKLITTSILLTSAGAMTVMVLASKNGREEVKASSPDTSARAPASVSSSKEVLTPTPENGASSPSTGAMLLDNTKAKQWTDFKYQSELKSFAVITNKAIPTAEDNLNKRKLLQDANFILSLKPLLMVAADHEDAAHLQNIAIDLLFESLKSESRDAAIQVLTAVVADASIENTERSPSERQTLAGVKAEVLYNWSSQEPSSDSAIAGILPGPVSQKIWANVKSRQDNNVAESLAMRK